MKYLSIALRNLNRQKKRTFLLGGGIAFGVLIVTLISSLAGSFAENINENFSRLLAGHVFVEGVEKSESGRSVSVIRDEEVLIKTLRQETSIEPEYLTKRSSFQGNLIFEGEQAMQVISGVDWSEERYMTERLALKEGDFSAMLQDRRAIILNEQVAEQLAVRVGDEIVVQLRTATGQQNVGEFRVAAVSYDTGLFGAMSAYASLGYVNELLNLRDNEYQTLGIFLPRLGRMDEAAREYHRALREKVQLFEREEQGQGAQTSPFSSMMEQAEEQEWEGTRYRVYTLNDILSEVQQLVGTLNAAGFGILIVLFLIIMVGITNTFRMIMNERTKEIGTMRALGMQKPAVRRLFLTEALCLSLGGILAGLVLAAAVMLGVSAIDFGTETQFYILMKNGHVTFKPSLLQSAGHVLLIVLLTLAAAYVPARKAARMRPADALRTSR
jgi:putative ABC transport system permease protein